MRFPVTLSNPVSTGFTVYASSYAGTASAGAGDYKALASVPVTWLPGQSGTKFVTVQVTADTVHEETEQFSVVLSGPSVGRIGRGTATGTIKDDDAAPPPPATKSVAGVFRNGQWFLDLAGDGGNAEKVVNFGLPGDTAVSADWNRDGRTDLTVVRPVNGYLYWYIDLNLDGQTDRVQQFGLAGDTPVAGDFDGNKTTDMAVTRKNYSRDSLDWYVDLANNGGNAEWVAQFGYASTGDVPQAADWNNDGKTDLGVYRAGSSYQSGGQWIINVATPSGWLTLNLGNAAWNPVVGDFNGDGVADAAIWRFNEAGNVDWLIDTNHDGTIDAGLHYGLVGDQVLAGTW